MLSVKRTVLILLALAASFHASAAAAHGDCSTDADCESGEICFQEACSATCESDADCSEDQVCTDATACQHPEEDEGCTSAPRSNAPGIPIAGIALAAAVALRLLRSRSR
jgi:hypothetical protein